MTARTRDLKPKTHGAEATRSICPYCGVGCGQIVYHKKGELISIEGDPQSPISRGHLCPKGADTYELHTHPARLKTVKYRAPYSRRWQKSIYPKQWTWWRSVSGALASGRSRKHVKTRR